jgi:hypothetical protein
VNSDNRPDSCTSIAFQYLGINTTVIEFLQAKRPLHTIPFPWWLEFLELCALDQLERYAFEGSLQEFVDQHPFGKFLLVIAVTQEENIALRKTHAVAVVNGVVYNNSNTHRPVAHAWKRVAQEKERIE